MMWLGELRGGTLFAYQHINFERTPHSRHYGWDTRASTMIPQDPLTSRFDHYPGNGDITELFLLLPAQQVNALEEAAFRQGLTTAALMRHLIEDYITRTRERLPA